MKFPEGGELGEERVVLEEIPSVGEVWIFCGTTYYAFVMIYVKFHSSVCFVIKCATKIFLFMPPYHCCPPLKKVLDIKSKLINEFFNRYGSLFMVELTV